MLPKVNKADMEGTMDAIKEYLRLFHGVMRVHLAYVIRKTTIVETCGDYPKYATSDDKMITRMSHLPPEKKRLHHEQSAQSVREPMAEYEIDNSECL